MTTIKRAPQQRAVYDDEPPSMAWMPLEGVTQQWATFAETFLSYAAPATSTNRRPPTGDIITYCDSKGKVIIEEEEADSDDASPSRLPNSAIHYQRLADVLTEELPRAGKSVVPPRSKAVQHLPPEVVLVQGVPCINVGDQWVEVVLHRCS